MSAHDAGDPSARPPSPSPVAAGAAYASSASPASPAPEPRQPARLDSGARAAEMMADLQIGILEFQALVDGLHEHFPFCGYIRETAHRGITLPQLERINGFAKDHCRQWQDKTTKQQLDMRSLNLYHLNAWCILPATSDDNCAMVELLVGHSQRPQWFCSHWWGEPIQDFAACVQKHVSVRQLPSSAAYWVCAYANRQHMLNQELVKDPRQSSFYKAMQMSRGVLLILDTIGPATPFMRIWCAFEEATAIQSHEEDQSEPMLLDIAAAGENSRVDLLADSLTDSELVLQRKESQGYGHQLKLVRESTFPLKVLAQGLELRVESAEATQADDKKHILNTLAKRHLDAEPLEADEGYEKVNRQLRARFALAVWVQAVARGATEALPFQRVLREDKWRQSLHMSLSMLRDILTDAEVAYLAGALPPGLQTLSLDLQGCKNLGDRGLAALGEALQGLAHLQKLQLNLSGTVVGDPGMAALGEALLRLGGLKELQLDVRSTGVADPGIAALAAGLPRGLERLYLVLPALGPSERGLAALAERLPGALEALEVATMGMASGSMWNHGGVIALAAAVRGLASLRHFRGSDYKLELDASRLQSRGEELAQQGYEAARAAEPAAASAAAAPATLSPRRAQGIEALRRLSLKPPTEGVTEDDFWQALAVALRHASLDSLDLDLEDAKVTEADIAAVGAALPRTLATLRLQHAAVLTDGMLESLAAGLPASLRELRMEPLGRNCGDSGVEALAARLPEGLHHLDLAFDVCKGLTDGGVGALARGLPPGLLDLRLRLDEVGCGDRGVAALARRLPDLEGLQRLDLDISLRQLTDDGVAALAKGLPVGLQELCLGLERTGCGDVGLAALAERLPAGLQRLVLRPNANERLTDRGVAALAAGLPGALQWLHLEFSYDGQLTDSSLVALGDGLPQGLQELELRIDECPQITDHGMAAFCANLPATLGTDAVRLEFKDQSLRCLQRVHSWVEDYKGAQRDAAVQPDAPFMVPSASESQSAAGSGFTQAPSEDSSAAPFGATGSSHRW